jgi:hypothetical protein
MEKKEDATRTMLRHTLATLAYRGGKAVRGAPPSFAGYASGPTSRTPGQILAHIGDLMDWALSMARGAESWHNSPPLPWEEETARFFASLAAFDAFLAGTDALRAPVERLFQGPVADALTHVGQIAMLRRMAGCPMRGENYFVADIAVGRIGSEQTPGKREFD